MFGPISSWAQQRIYFLGVKSNAWTQFLLHFPAKVMTWRLRDRLPKRSPKTGPIEPPFRTYEYFWLDKFCILQDIQHADLKYKAIGSMSLIYAAAA